jgi:hypothetical protein
MHCPGEVGSRGKGQQGIILNKNDPGFAMSGKDNGHMVEVCNITQ